MSRDRRDADLYETTTVVVTEVRIVRIPLTKADYIEIGIFCGLMLIGLIGMSHCNF